MSAPDLKRPAGSASVVAVAPKQARTDVVGYGGDRRLAAGGPGRTSSLQAPIMLLTGHEGEIYCGKFSPTGAILASAGYERKILLWTVYGECDNFAVLLGHGGAVLDMQFTSDGDTLLTAAADKTAALWDLQSGARVKRLKGHSKVVTGVDVARRGPQLICTGSDDATVRLWDRRRRGQTHAFNCEYAVTACAFNDTAEMIFSAGIDNVVKSWDLRKMSHGPLRLKGHEDTVTGLSLSPDGNCLLSNSMDNSLRIWDVRPYSPHDRCLKILAGHQHNFEQNLLRCAWQPDGKRVSAGSADRYVYAWDVASRQVAYKLPGHAGSVNETHFHPKEPVIASFGSDKKIYIGELEPSGL